MNFNILCPNCGKALRGVVMMADIDEWGCADCTANSDNILHCEEGSKVRYDRPRSGWDGEKEAIAKVLTQGEVYTVKEIRIYSSYSDVELMEHPGRYFNTTFFSRVH